MDTNKDIDRIEEKDCMHELKLYVKEQMVLDEDYGKIPGCGTKPTLLKPGAEKLCFLFGYACKFDISDKERDCKSGYFYYQIKCALVSKKTGYVVAEGLGSANTKENKFIRRDPYTMDNTILKIAKKRALVDATLTAVRGSGLFTQDLEDIREDIADKPAPIAEKVAVVNGEPVVETFNLNETDAATKPQLQAIYAISKQVGMNTDQARDMMMGLFSKENSVDLTKKEASEFISKLKEIETDMV